MQHILSTGPNSEETLFSLFSFVRSLFFFTQTYYVQRSIVFTELETGKKEQKQPIFLTNAPNYIYYIPLLPSCAQTYT